MGKDSISKSRERERKRKREKTFFMFPNGDKQFCVVALILHICSPNAAVRYVSMFASTAEQKEDSVSARPRQKPALIISEGNAVTLYGGGAQMARQKVKRIVAEYYSEQIHTYSFRAHMPQHTHTHTHNGISFIPLNEKNVDVVKHRYVAVFHISPGNLWPGLIFHDRSQ